MKKQIIFAIMAAAVVTGCNDKVDMSDKDKEPAEQQLAVEGSKFSAKIGESSAVKITSGNGGYEVMSNNKDIVDVRVDDKGIITIDAKAEGQVMVTVGDKLAKETFFSVVSEKPYFLWFVSRVYADVEASSYHGLDQEIREELLEKAAIYEGSIFQFVAGAERNLLLFENSEALRKGEVSDQGTYAFDVNGVTMIFDGDTNTYSPQNQLAVTNMQYLIQYLTGIGGQNISAVTKVTGPRIMEIGNDYTEHYVDLHGIHAVNKATLTYYITPMAYKNFN